MLVVAGAWYAQKLLVGDLRTGRERAPDLLSEGGAPEPPPLPGWGHVVLGAPSGAEPRPRPIVATPPPSADAEGQPGEPASGPGPRSEPIAPPRWPEDLELVVRPGQMLSKIAAAEYGRATEELVMLLAAYNGLSDPNKLQAGQTLRVPVKDKLLATR